MTSMSDHDTETTADARADDVEDLDVTVDPNLGYADASAELDEILAKLERDDLDVDELGVLVARAAALVEHCRGRIAAAKLQLKKFDRAA